MASSHSFLGSDSNSDTESVSFINSLLGLAPLAECCKGIASSTLLVSQPAGEIEEVLFMSFRVESGGSGEGLAARIALQRVSRLAAANVLSD
jgi:hypothetical protein